jgi:hypothetical protein
VQGVVDGFGARLLGASKDLVRVRVVARQADAFGAASRDRDGRVKGAWVPGANGEPGTVVLVAENLGSVTDAQTVLRHEVIGHYGLDLLDPADKAEFLRRVDEAAGGTRYLRRLRSQVEAAEGPERAEMLVALLRMGAAANMPNPGSLS